MAKIRWMEIEPLHPDSDLIDRAGGTAAVAKLCKIRQPSVSKWRKQGISRARRDLLALLRPDIDWTRVAEPAEKVAA